MDEVNPHMGLHCPKGVRHGAPARTLTPAQLMERLQLSENVVYYQLQYGCLKDIAFRIGRQWRVSEAALDRLTNGPGDAMRQTVSEAERSR